MSVKLDIVVQGAGRLCKRSGCFRCAMSSRYTELRYVWVSEQYDLLQASRMQGVSYYTLENGDVVKATVVTPTEIPPTMMDVPDLKLAGRGRFTRYTRGLLDPKPVAPFS